MWRRLRRRPQVEGLDGGDRASGVGFDRDEQLQIERLLVIVSAGRRAIGAAVRRRRVSGEMRVDGAGSVVVAVVIIMCVNHRAGGHHRISHDRGIGGGDFGRDDGAGRIHLQHGRQHRCQR